MNPTNHRLYVQHHGALPSDRWALVDGTDCGVLSDDLPLQCGFPSRQMLYNSADNRFYAMGYNAASVGAFDGDTGTLVSCTPLPPGAGAGGFGISLDGASQVLYTTSYQNGSTRLYKVPLPALAPITFIEPGITLDGVSVDAFGCTLNIYVAAHENGEAWVAQDTTPPPVGDLDCDGVPDTTDNCLTSPNPLQENSDSGPQPPLPGRTGDIGVVDNGPDIVGDDGTIPNGDSLGDACDPDHDYDGSPDISDTEPQAGSCGAFTGTGDANANPAGLPFWDYSNDDNHNRSAAPPMGTDGADNGPSWDTDNDGLLDGVECQLGTNPRDRASRPAVTQCGANVDADNDGLTAAIEGCKWGTSDTLADSDGDGLTDCIEANDTNGDGVQNFPSDTINSAKAANNIIGKTMDFDLNGDGVVNFPGDTILSAELVNHVGGICI